MATPCIVLAEILLIAISCCIFCQAQDYCGRFGQSHTMCQYQENSGCRKGNRGVDEAAKRDILNSHNTLRAKVANGQQSGQPGASNMKELVWDQELASIAQRWADQCKNGHDSSHSSFKFPDWVGQNVAWSSSSSSDNKAEFGRSAVQPWYDEVSQFSPQNIDPFRFSGATGHYTQVVWAETSSIGCGYAFYGGSSKSYVCNYGPGGNFGRGPVYKKGQACSACSGGCSSNYPGLCAPSSRDIVVNNSTTISPN